MILNFDLIINRKRKVGYDYSMIKGSDSEFRELGFISAVFVISEELWLIGFESTENVVSVDTGSEVLEKFVAFLILQ